MSVRTIEVPFCSTCSARHRLEARPVGVVRIVASFFATPFVLPVVVAFAGFAGYFAPQTEISVARSLLRSAFFAIAAVVFGAAVWYQTRRRRVTPPTSVTSAFDFSDNLGGLFGTEHRVYGMENARFAQAFMAANADRMWSPDVRNTR